MIRKLHITCFFLLVSISVFAQTFACDHTFYVVMQVEGKSVLYNMWLNESGGLNSKAIPLSEPGRQYTCLGFSIEDLHLYALDFNTKELLRIDAEGNVTNLGIPENLDTSLEYRAGDVMPEGRRLVVVGYDQNFEKDRSVFSINLTTANHYAGSSGVVAYLPTEITDLATDPIRGITYGYDELNRQIVVIGTNAIAHHNHRKIEPVLESLFFDEKGNLYGYGSPSGASEQTTLYAIDKVKGGITPVANHQVGSFGDGCSCPYTMSFTRSIYPPRIFPCTEFTIDYHLLNHAGIGKTGVVLEDILPPEVTITEMVDHTFTLATVESGVGTNQLYIPNLDVLIGHNIISLKATLNATASQVFETQAGLENLPLGLGGSLLSDDPLTPELGDPNLTEVLQSNDFELEDYLRYHCGQDTVTLALPFSAQSYRWSDGSTDPTLSVTEAGLYWVEAVGACFTIRDSIQISSFPEPLHLDLGPDQSVKEGTALTLQPGTNAAFIQQWTWASAGDFDLSCLDCATPELTAQRDNLYFLELTDGNGCKVRDSLQVTVTPAREVYVPNAFSPNGDGINDVFFIQGSNSLATIRRFEVRDRWGNAVFSDNAGMINEEASGWDGRVNGRTAATGVYIWFAEIEYPDGEVEKISGEITLLAH